MGKLLLVWRLAARDVRHHLAQALLLVVAIAAATATLTMALALNGVTKQPYQQTRAATNGPDVVAYTASTSQAGALVHAHGVVASSGPYPIVSVQHQSRRPPRRCRSSRAAAQPRPRSTSQS